eukprot:gene4015-7995_t
MSKRDFTLPVPGLEQVRFLTHICPKSFTDNIHAVSILKQADRYRNQGFQSGYSYVIMVRPAIPLIAVSSLLRNLAPCPILLICSSF